MTAKVQWSRESTMSLSRIWAGANDPAAVHRVKDQIELLLGSNPRAGKEIREGLLVPECEFLRFHYELEDADRLVTVVSVNPMGKT